MLQHSQLISIPDSHLDNLWSMPEGHLSSMECRKSSHSGSMWNQLWISQYNFYFWTVGSSPLKLSFTYFHSYTQHDINVGFVCQIIQT